jgi:hypothetical protein
MEMLLQSLVSGGIMLMDMELMQDLDIQKD